MELFKIDSGKKGMLPIDKDVFKKSFAQWVKDDGAGQYYANSGILAFDKEEKNLKFFKIIAILKTDDLRN